MRRTPRCLSLCALWISAAAASPATVEDQAAATGVDPKWDITVPRGMTRMIDFTTEQGTWMSVTPSPDGRWIAFDLLGHIYRVPTAGGEAQCLTQDSGIALNFHSAYSPDGRHIAFLSDRGGYANLWVMEADGSNPRLIAEEQVERVLEPAWMPDGQSIVVRRQLYAEGRFWVYPISGGPGKALSLEAGAEVGFPSVSANGRFLYYHRLSASKFDVEADYESADILSGDWQLYRLDLTTAEVTAVTSGPGGGIAPRLSSDGQWLAFARRIPDGTIEYRGRRFGPRTALWLKDLRTGEERVLMDPIEPDLASKDSTLSQSNRLLPDYGWSADGRWIVLSQGGKLRKVQVATGEVHTIAFRARVKREISERAGPYPRPLSDGPVPARYLRWPVSVATPKGRQVVFQSFGRLWGQEIAQGSGSEQLQLRGKPKRLTPESFGPLEYTSSPSPDGRWIAFASWDEQNKAGHLWKLPAQGGEPIRLTVTAGKYLYPAWRSDGQQLVAVALRTHAMSETVKWHELIRLPAEGGRAETVRRFKPLEKGIIAAPSYGEDDRIYYQEEVDYQAAPWVGTELVSFGADGSDRKVHFSLPYAYAIQPSADRKWIAYQHGGNLYLARGNEEDRASRWNPQAKQITFEGGLFPRWRDRQTLEFGSATRFFSHDVATGKTVAVDLQLQLPRPTPKGTVKFDNARIITLEGDAVLEKASLVVEGRRIACVGKCDGWRADRAFDLNGKTIIPGFIEGHGLASETGETLITSRRESVQARMLAFGVTTSYVPNTGEVTDYFYPMAELLEAGEAIGPRLVGTTGPLSLLQGYGRPKRDQPHRRDGGVDLSSPRVVQQTAERLVSWGSLGMKFNPGAGGVVVRRDRQQWLAEVARQKRLLLSGHSITGYLEHPLSMAMDGCTASQHFFKQRIIYDDVIQFFGRAGHHINANLSNVDANVLPQQHGVWLDERVRQFTPWWKLLQFRDRPLRPEVSLLFPMLAQSAADLVAAGATVSISSELTLKGIGEHWELWMLADAMGPLAGLKTASLYGARFLGMEQDIGSIRVGKIADLIFLNKNPLENIRHSKEIKYVMKDGVLYESMTLNEIWPRSKPFGKYPWLDSVMMQTDVRAWSQK